MKLQVPPLPPKAGNVHIPHQLFSKDKSCRRQILSVGFSSSGVRMKCNATCFKKTNGDLWKIPFHSRMETIS